MVGRKGVNMMHLYDLLSNLNYKQMVEIIQYSDRRGKERLFVGASKKLYALMPHLPLRFVHSQIDTIKTSNSYVITIYLTGTFTVQNIAQIRRVIDGI